MRVAILSSEAVPFAKTGGLGDVASALPAALAGAGLDASLIIPLYEKVDRGLISHRAFDDVAVEWMNGVRHVQVFYSDHIGAPTFLIDAPEYFARPGFYGYRDDHERFAFFSRAALALLRRLGAPPDIIHGNDWFCGFASVELKERRAYDEFFRHTRTLFSIHNLAYQGAFDLAELPRLGFGSHEARMDFETGGAASALKAGLVASDMLSTVSRRYSYEIQMPEHGYGLDGLLRERRDRLAGITNGIDYAAWNPATDRYTAAHFTSEHLEAKRLCKLDLLRQFNLPDDLDRPIIASISRLTSQKGFDLIQQAAGAISETDAFFISLGSGADEYENFFQAWRDAMPHRIGVYRGFSESLAHKIEAGADIFLMPSAFEPCGLNQMYSMRYGTIPVVRATGGLDDTVEQYDRARGTGTGFKFRDYTAVAMTESLYEALYCYQDPAAWRRIQRNGMAQDNSWQRAAWRYRELYEGMQHHR